jgi:hypothetical protein
VAILTTQPILSGPDRKEKPMFRHKLLERVQRLAAAAKANYLRIERYKRLYDAQHLLRFMHPTNLLKMWDPLLQLLAPHLSPLHWTDK